jgi:hypothetical protein
MIRETGQEGMWLIAIAFGVFVVFVLARFNRHKLDAWWRRWEDAPRYMHMLAWGVYCVLFAWLTANRTSDDHLYMALAWGVFSALAFAQAAYFFITRNKPIDTSPRAVRRRAMRGILWSVLAVLPLVWMIAQTASGAETANWPWPIGVGLAIAGAIIFIDSVRKLREPQREGSSQPHA